jgi:hypothetical protein
VIFNRAESNDDAIRSRENNTGDPGSDSITLTVAPEPASLGLLALGGLMLLRRRRR